MTGLTTKKKRVINGGTFRKSGKSYRKNKKHRIQKRVTKEKLMTVCIAAIADASTPSPKIVFAADRLVSSWVNFESGVPKIRQLTNYAFVLIATNDAPIANGIILKAEEQIKSLCDERLTIEQIVKMISKECKNRLSDERERYVLSPFGLTYDGYITKSNDTSKELINDIAANLRDFEDSDYEFEAEFMIIGIEDRPLIYIVNQKGDYTPSDYAGFATIGSGKYMAFPEITKFTYHPDVDMGQALVRVYNSKKIAERVGGVGKETDLGVLHITQDKNVALWLADDVVKKLLDKGINDVKDQEIKIYSDVIKELYSIFSKGNGETKSDKS